jgi:uncharacterized protein involved in response to NO
MPTPSINVTTGTSRLPAIFAAGFRPLFLAAGVWATFAALAWVLVFATGFWPHDAPSPTLWHAHEMLFGFAAAAVGGFLLTAVPNWTGRIGYGGPPLVALVAVWAAGRLAMLAFPLAPAVAATIDLACFPALIATIAPSLLRARKPQNLPFPAILLALFAANLLTQLNLLGAAATGQAGTVLAIDVLLLLVTVIGGRVVPSFTLSWLRRRNQAASMPARSAWLDRVCIGGALVLAGLDLALPDSRAAGAAALVLAVAQAARLARWRGLATLGEPILWVVHLGYAWLAVGLALKAAWLLGDAAIGAQWRHALTIGAFSTMILGVMTRATLGHTGRPIVASGPIVAAYLLVSAAAIARVFGPALGGAVYRPAILVAGACWVAAFGIFSLVYAPILAGPRADSRPG